MCWVGSWVSNQHLGSRGRKIAMNLRPVLHLEFQDSLARVRFCLKLGGGLLIGHPGHVPKSRYPINYKSEFQENSLNWQ